MQISFSLKLKKKKDLDIICAAYNNRNFNKVIHEILECFCKGEIFQYEIEQIPTFAELPENKQIRITLNETDMFYSIYTNLQEAYKSCFIKIIIRKYLGESVYQIYFKNKNVSFLKTDNKLKEDIPKVIRKKQKTESLVTPNNNYEKKNEVHFEKEKEEKKQLEEVKSTLELQDTQNIQSKETPMDEKPQNETFDMFGALENMIDLY